MGIGLRLDLEALAELRLEECVESVLPSPRRIDRSSHGFFRSKRGVLALESTSVCLRSTPRAPTRVGGFGLSAGDSGCRASGRSVLLCSTRASGLRPSQERRAALATALRRRSGGGAR